ncbi:hypothetical protein CMV_004493 [Castanea mollissima]|uniref:Uncharacterized protein n=1 Tax=Castanea mollissima TaxID=60419 RepID=A0A8J4RET6_9ROSI|nr:hypothetical protein CMV_004493 [Castanea mollissima]
MICSVKQCVSRTIVASDLFLWKESHSLVPRIPLKKPNERPIILVSRALYVSITPIEKLSSKWEVSELVAAKKNIIGVYLAMWLALQHVFKLNLKQQLNALALSVMILNLFPGSRFIKLVNNTDSDIELSVYQCGVTQFTHTLKAQDTEEIKKKLFKKYITPHAPTTVFIEATNAKCEIKTLNPQDFTGYNELIFHIVKGNFHVKKIP